LTAKFALRRLFPERRAKTKKENMKTLDELKAEAAADTAPLEAAVFVMLEYLAESGELQCITHTPDGLLAYLQKHGGASTTDADFPRNTRALGRQLMRLAPEVNARGVIIEPDRDRYFGRLWTIATEEDYCPAPTAQRLKAEEARIYGR
jgi:hypothetical protein